MGRGFRLKGRRIGIIRKARWLALVALLSGLSWAWHWYNQQPVVGIITSSIGAQAGEVKSETTEAPGRYRSENLSFAYPAIYSDNQHTAPSGRIIEQYSMAAHMAKTESRRISIMVKSALVSSDMKEDSAYAFRKNAAEIYTLSQETSDKGLQVEKFSKQDGSEVTYFISNSSKYAIIAATSNVADGEFKADARIVINSFVWN